MKRTTPLALLCAALVFAAALQAAQEKISPELERWLEDVSPIITKAERAVFTKLQTNADRAKFVRFFWRSRDPLPDTAENEFQKDYEERIRYADQTFGHFSPKRGSQTDRGFFYVVLGKPLERTLYTTQSQIWPVELWFYKGEVEYGLPSYFYLIFYQPEGIGDFRLYSPGVEGPEKLVIPNMEAAVTRVTAVQELKAINGELANASLSYLPSDSSAGMASFSSDSIIASVHNFPEKKFSDGYARSYMNFKDYIETEYSDSYISSAFQTRLFREAGQTFLHWSIEPEKMNFGTQADAIYASYEFVLRLEDGRGSTVFERTEEIPLKLSPAQYQAHARQRFAFQDLLAVAPGEYRALFLLKNKTTKDFSSFETRVSVPQDDASARPGLSVPLLFYARTAVAEAQSRNLKAFVFGGQQYLVGARNEFPRSSTLGVFVQARNVSAGPAGPPRFPRHERQRRLFRADRHRPRPRRRGHPPCLRHGRVEGHQAGLLPGRGFARVLRRKTAHGKGELRRPRSAVPGRPLGLRAPARPVPGSRASPGPRLSVFREGRLRPVPGDPRAVPSGPRRSRGASAPGQVALRPGPL